MNAETISLMPLSSVECPNYGCTDHFLDALSPVECLPFSLRLPIHCNLAGAENLSTKPRHVVLFGALCITGEKGEKEKKTNRGIERERRRNLADGRPCKV